MTTTLFTAMLLLATSAQAQDQIQRRDIIARQLLEKVSLYGKLYDPFLSTEEYACTELNVESRLSIDSLTTNGLVYYYGNYWSGNKRQGVALYFQLQDIVCVEKGFLHDRRAIEVHIDQHKAIGIIQIGASKDSTNVMSWPTHKTIRIVLRWRGERHLFKKMYTWLSELAEINKKQKQQYAYHH